MGLLTSIGALAKDIMPPALRFLGPDLGAGDIKHTTLVVMVFFLGMALGHVAGLMAAIFDAISTPVLLPLSWLVSGYFENSIAPLVGGFANAGAMSLTLRRWAGRV